MVYSRVLIPVDRNETTRRAIQWGVEYGRRLDVPVDLLHVVEDGSGRLSLGTGSPSTPRASEFPDEIEVRDDAARVSRHVVGGVPQREILRFAAENDTDLIVMGQDGKTGVKNRLFDSVIDKVIQGASVPVLAIPPVRETCELERLLLPVSTRISSDGAIDHATTVAAEFGMTIHVVNVVNVKREAGPFDAGAVSKPYIEQLKRDARPAIDRALERAAELGSDTPIESAVITGSQHEAIDEYIAEHDIDLVVAGSYAESRVARRILGHVTEHVLQTVDVPVLVVSNPA